MNRIPLVILNGPPGCGKDTAAIALQDFFAAVSLPLSEYAKNGTLHLYGAAAAGMEIEDMEKDKSIKRPSLQGRSWREAVITSTEVFNMLYGWDFWARVMHQNLIIMDNEATKDPKQSYMAVVTDLCAPAQLLYLEQRIAAMGREAILIRLHREGRSFKKYPGYEEAYGQNTGDDSRNWVFSDTIPQVDIENNGSVDALRNNIVFAMRQAGLKVRARPDMRNDRTWLHAYSMRGYHSLQTIKMEPFAKPYRVYKPTFKSAAPEHESIQVLEAIDPATLNKG